MVYGAFKVRGEQFRHACAEESNSREAGNLGILLHPLGDFKGPGAVDTEENWLCSLFHFSPPCFVLPEAFPLSSGSSKLYS